MAPCFGRGPFPVNTPTLNELVEIPHPVPRFAPTR